jgi:hypothetical protein
MVDMEDGHLEVVAIKTKAFRTDVEIDTIDTIEEEEEGATPTG